MWYTSGREVARGFSTTVAFRCDGAKVSALGSVGEEIQGGDAANRPQGTGEKEGSIIFTVHNHRDALSGEWAANRVGDPAAVPNSLSVCVTLDGAGGGEVSLRYQGSCPSPCCKLASFFSV